MQDVNVVIVFDSRDESMERLALAAAVGAVQGRAFIRLRRFPGTPEHREYVMPRDTDAEWAHAILLVGEPILTEAESWAASLRQQTNSFVIRTDAGSTEAATQQGRRAAEEARLRRDRTSSGAAADRS